MMDLVKDNVGSIRVKSNILPEIVIDPFPEGAKTSPNIVIQSIMRFVQPQVLVDTAFGEINVAPEGAPDKAYFPFVVGISAVFTLLALYGAYRLIAD